MGAVNALPTLGSGGFDLLGGGVLNSKKAKALRRHVYLIYKDRKIADYVYRTAKKVMKNL